VFRRSGDETIPGRQTGQHIEKIEGWSNTVILVQSAAKLSTRIEQGIHYYAGAAEARCSLSVAASVMMFVTAVGFDAKGT
jgi:hypothetical protein